MAKKKSGFGRFLGAITGTPYERLLKQVDKLLDQYDDDEDELANQLEAMVDQAGDAYEEENIDDVCADCFRLHSAQDERAPQSLRT